MIYYEEIKQHRSNILYVHTALQLYERRVQHERKRLRRFVARFVRQCKPNPNTPYFIFVNGVFGIVAFQ